MKIGDTVRVHGRGGEYRDVGMVGVVTEKATCLCCDWLVHFDDRNISRYYKDIHLDLVEDEEQLELFSVEDMEASTPYDLDPFDSDVTRVYAEAQSVLLAKHADYGPLNILRSPGGPINGLRVRIWDKIARINNLVDSNADPENESLRDSFLDLMNYAAIGLLVLDGNWPGQESENV